MTTALHYFNLIPQFFFTWSIFFAAGASLYLGATLRARRAFSLKELVQGCVPLNPITSKSFHMDVWTYFITKLTLAVWTIPGFAAYALISKGISKYLHLEFGALAPHHPSPYIAVFCAFIVFISIEFAYYIVHFTNHRVPFLWELHKVHHSADALNPLTNTRAHPLDQTYKFAVTGMVSAVPTGIFMFWFGFSLPEFVVLNAVANKLASVLSLDTLRHSHVPVRFGGIERIVMSPHMHHIHHSSAEEHIDRNFGLNLSVFDWMFGTLYRPEKGERPTVGMCGYSRASLQEFNTLWGVYVMPLKRALRTAARPLRIRLGTQS